MRKSAELRKVEIVAAVLSLADRIGPDRVTTGAVAIAIGVTHAAFFRHFPTKSAMWKAVAETVAASMAEAWDLAVNEPGTPADRLKRLVAAQLDQIAATPALPMLLFSRELNVENDKLRLAFRAALRSYKSRIIREVEAAQQKGAIRPDVAAEDVALLLTSLIQGVAIRWALGPRNFSLREEGMRLFGVQMKLFSREAL